MWPKNRILYTSANKSNRDLKYFRMVSSKYSFPTLVMSPCLKVRKSPNGTKSAILPTLEASLLHWIFLSSAIISWFPIECGWNMACHVTVNIQFASSLHSYDIGKFEVVRYDGGQGMVFHSNFVTNLQSEIPDRFLTDFWGSDWLEKRAKSQSFLLLKWGRGKQ